ncbi:MAG: hypothetical protein JNG84_04550 [Archangium sp.]|nr:hypothetical protein [Archangium sp.]
MSRDSRFDKLEIPRTPRKAEDSPRLDRFGADDAAPAPAPAVQPGEAMRRFEEDGGAGVHLDRDALASLPFRRCPACQRDSSKWDTACIFCRAPLDTPEAIAFNLQLLTELEATRTAEKQAIESSRHAEVVHRANEQAEVILQEARHRREQETTSRRLAAAAVALVCFAILWGAPWYTLKFFAFVGFVLSLSVAVPADVWRRLAESGRKGPWS